MILHRDIPYPVDRPRPLPGVAPLDMGDWLLVDDVFSEQMTLRETLLARRRRDVVAALPGSEQASGELLETVLGALPAGFGVSGDHVERPDGRAIFIDPSDPLGTLGRLVQEDFCILEKPGGGGEHVLSAAVLCFPSAWTLSEKIGKPLTAIHSPVPAYDDGIGQRVQRLFDGLQPGRPLWRWNRLASDTADLYHPMTQADAAARDVAEPAPFVRSERQVLARLPRCRAVVFSIHTYLIRAE